MGPNPQLPEPQIWQTNAPEGYPRWSDSDTFDWRIPVVYDKIKNRHLVGQPGMEHNVMMQNFEEYADNNDPWAVTNRFTPGYVDLEGHTGTPGLHWFNRSPHIPDTNLHDYIEAEHGVRNHGDENPFNAQSEEYDLWSQ